MDSDSFGEMEHKIDFTDAKIVETCRPLAAVMNDDTVHGDVWSAARANDFDSLRRLLKDGNSHLWHVDHSFHSMLWFGKLASTE